MTAPESDVLTMPTPIAVIPRNVHFTFAKTTNKAWLGGDPVGTAVFNALSLTFPEGEKLFIDAVRAHRHLLSGQLLEEANAFIAQEAIHTREHIGLNKLLDRGHYPVEAIEAEIKKRTDFNRGQGPIAMLSVTIALEHFTAMMADWFLSDRTLLSSTDPEIARLWEWHAMEETEHKAVAFDVYLEATKDWPAKQRLAVRNRVMRLVTIMFTRNVTRFAAKLLAADGMNPVLAHARVLWFLFGKPGLFRKSWKNYADWYKPDFHPWNHDNRALLDAWRGKFVAETLPKAA